MLRYAVLIARMPQNLPSQAAKLFDLIGNRSTRFDLLKQRLDLS
jgi:hypothetical protein